MKSQIKNFLLIYILFCHATYAQGQKKNPQFHFLLGKSSDNSLTMSKEAEVIGTFTKTANTPNSWLANGFLSFSISNPDKNAENDGSEVNDDEFNPKNIDRWEFGLVTELHRNTLIEKKQDVRQYGITGKYVFVQSSLGTSKSEVPLSLSVKESIDNENDTKTLQAIAGISFRAFSGPSFLRTNAKFPALGSLVGRNIQFSHDHNIGIAYLGQDENILLGQVDLEFRAFLFPSLVKKWTKKQTDLFKAQITYTNRTPLIGKTSLELHSQVDLQVGFNLKFNEVNSLGIAYDWVQGANPLEGLKNQKYQTLTAKIKFKI